MTANPSESGPTPAAADRGLREVKLLRRAVARDFIEANVLGGAIIATFYVAFQQASLPTSTRSFIAYVSLLTVPAFVLVLWISWRAARPLVDWLEHDDGVSHPPERLRISVVVQPAVQSVISISFWVVAALGFGLAEGITADGFAVRRFVLACAGTLVAGVGTSAIVYLRIEDAWRRWLPVFFRGGDPVSLPLPPADRLRARLRFMFTIGTVIPLVAMALVATFRGEASTAELSSMAWFLAIAGIFVGAVFSVNVRHSILAPIHGLQDAMEKVEEGDFAVRVPIDRIDELGRLQHGFNEMVEGLAARERVEDLFGRQVGEQVAEAALIAARTGEAEMRLGGEVRSVSALFVDLASFSTLAEFAQPTQLAQLLNVVFEAVVEAVEAVGGLVNKFQGDAVLAVFGAPRDDAVHAVHALEAAAQIAGRLEGMRLDFGIGISSGEVFAGNIGSASRFEYTVVGDAVNEAARLQELSRELGRTVLVNGDAAVAARGAGGRAAAGLVPVGEFVLRGKTGATEVYSLSPQLWRGASVDAPEQAGDAGERGDAGVAMEPEEAEDAVDAGLLGEVEEPGEPELPEATREAAEDAIALGTDPAPEELGAESR